MARRIKDATLDSRAARLKLAPRGEPYWRQVEKAVHVGYRRRPAGKAGTWVMRAFADSHYKIDRIGNADDLFDADGTLVLTMWQAIDAVRARMAKLGEVPRRDAGPTARTTVREALNDYATEHKGDAARVLKHGGDLLDKQIGLLTADDIKKWRRALRTKVKVERICNSLRAALNAAADNDKHIDRHAWKVGLSQKKSDEGTGTRNVILNANAIGRIVGAAYDVSESFGLLVETAATTGARVDQLARITVGDLEGNRLSIPVSRKGNCKNKPADTTVNIPASLALRLKGVAKGKPGHALLLVKANGARWGKSQHNRPFERMVRKLKLDPRDVTGCSPDQVTLGALRHSHIVWQIQKLVPIRTVATLHDTSISMIEKTYSKKIALVSEGVPVFDVPETRSNVVALKK
jgi:Phage integrase family